MATLTAQVTPEFVEQIDAAAKQLDRSRAWVIKHALRKFLDERLVEQKRWEETLEAIDVAERGGVVDAEEVFNWLDTWGQPDEEMEIDR